MRYRNITFCAIRPLRGIQRRGRARCLTSADQYYALIQTILLIEALKDASTDPTRVSRHWLVLSVATLSLAYGTRVARESWDYSVTCGRRPPPNRLGKA